MAQCPRNSRNCGQIPIAQIRILDRSQGSSTSRCTTRDTIVRQHAAEWKIDPTQIGVMGFSAGGHLASTLSTQYTHDLTRSKDAVDSISARPDFSILVYPVISFRDASAHSGSRDALIGAEASQELIDRFSGELNVTADTPPTFLVHAQDDKGVPIENSLLYYKALHNHQVKAALHIYPTGLYGYGIKGFMLSMIETALRITDQNIPTGMVEKILEIGKDMLAKPVELIGGVEKC
ncbi:hypothetical protein GHT06_004108 [Daphnia sinensis]|uniref:BD-FAE-like domain-containing protein n=1 Tax=Daphnia sinensis TaxID=1820382 RepID=A0AAD5PLE9_9CRUS|nr:hypothetical protein GHT06_004108 [Daphnia sinensis]